MVMRVKDGRVLTNAFSGRRMSKGALDTQLQRSQALTRRIRNRGVEQYVRKRRRGTVLWANPTRKVFRNAEGSAALAIHASWVVIVMHYSTVREGWERPRPSSG